MSSSPPPSANSPTLGRKRKVDTKPNESWFLILVNAFKSNFEQTLTYRESELYSWIMQAYPYYRHDMHTMMTSVKTTLSSYECFRQNGRSTWTFIPRRALVHLESLKSEDSRMQSDDSEDDDLDKDFDQDDLLDQDHSNHPGHDYPGQASSRLSHSPEFAHSHLQDGRSPTGRVFVDSSAALLDADSPTLSPEEIQRFKQEHSGAMARKLKRKASSGHASRPRTRSPQLGLQDECSMSMEAWCNLLVQMFEASPKQKTIREIYAWVHDNYPIYQNAPGDAWQADLTAALESNPLFRAMGRGRWQMAVQPVMPTVVINGPSGLGHSSVQTAAGKEDENATDSPSVTEDEDWKAIGSKRLLNFSFRRYSIATDTFPKNHYKVGSTVVAGSNLSTSSASPAATAIATAAATPTSTATTSGDHLSPFTQQDPRPVGYSNARRFSSYHQPTPKNSPPLSATAMRLPSVEEFGSDLKTALSEETDEDEDLTKKYMAPLQSAINSAIRDLQPQPSGPSFQISSAPMDPSQDQPHTLVHAQSSALHIYYPQSQPQQGHPSPQLHLSEHGPSPKPTSPFQRQLQQDLLLAHSRQSQTPPALSPLLEVQTETARRKSVSFAPEHLPPVHEQDTCDSARTRSTGLEPASTPVIQESSPLLALLEATKHHPLPLSPQGSLIEPSSDETAQRSLRPEPEIVIPNEESLALDQVAAIQALALLCGGGV